GSFPDHPAMPRQDGYAGWLPLYFRRRCALLPVVRTRPRGSTMPRAARRLRPRIQPPSGLGALPFPVGLSSRLAHVPRYDETDDLMSVPSTVAKPISTHGVEDAVGGRNVLGRYGEQGRPRRQENVLAEQSDVRG